MHCTKFLPQRVVLAACLMAFALAFDTRDTWAVGEAVNGFPNWAERVIHEWINRARVDPQLEMNACGSPCVERACYTVMPPLTWNEALNHAARFHSDEMVRQGYFAHNSACTLVANINSLYPASCDASASCACVGGTRACSPTCTDFAQRIQLFGGSPSGEIIASPSDPNQSFYLWLFEPGDTTNCQFTLHNGHRWLILKSTGAVGAGVAGYSTGDFGAGGAPAKIPSAAHYPRQAASVDVWANWYDAAGPSLASVNVDGTCTSMILQRGTLANGAWSATVTGVGSGCHRYYLSFVDSAGLTVTYPTNGSLAIGSGAGCPDWDSTRPAACGTTATATSSPTPTRTPAPPTSTASRTSTPLASSTPTPPPTPPPTSTASPTPTATSSSTPSLTATPLRRDVSGYVRYYGSALPVPGAMVHATSSTTATGSVTDTSGQYVFTDLPAEDINVYPDKTGDEGDAIGTLDATYVLQAVVGLRELSAEQRLACDVTGNGSLSGLDAALILRHVVGLIPRFPVATACDSDWVFFPNPAPPYPTLIQPQPGLVTCTPGTFAYHPLTGQFDAQNFSALLFGDCSGDWRPPGGSGGAGSRARASNSAVRARKLRRLRSGRLVLPIYVDALEPVSGADVRVVYDPATLRAVSARPVGSARGALLAFNGGEPGAAHIALARGRPIDARSGPLLAVMFETQNRRGVTAPSVSGRIDGD